MKRVRIGYLLAMSFVAGCSSSSEAAHQPAGNAAPDGSLGEAVDALDSGAPTDADDPIEAAPVLGTGTVIADGSSWDMTPGMVEYFTTDAGTFAYYPDASNALCPVPTCYLCINNFFALCLRDVYTSTIDPCNFNPDGSIQVWTGM
jgi:hypothetical protein